MAPQVLTEPSAGRAQSNVIGVVLVIAITVMGTTVVIWTGLGVLNSVTNKAEMQGAEQAMTTLDSQASLVGLGGSESKRVRFPKRNADLRVEEDAGWMNVSVLNATTGSVDTVVTNTTMGAVYYQRSDSTLAYQGGGVWKQQQGGSIMVSPPEFHYRLSKRGAPTVTLPLVSIQGGGSLSERVLVQKGGDSTPKFPVDGDADRSNPLAQGKVVITVQSDFYDAWGAFFTARTNGIVTYDHANHIVEVELIIPFDDEYTNVVATTDPNGITANPGPPPTPYQMGISYPSADSLIEAEIDECETNASACDETPPDPLTAGTYYYDSGLSGDLDIDTSAGNVTLVVDGDVTPGTIDVSGPNSVTVYVRGDFAFGGNDDINAGRSADTMTLVVHSEGSLDMNGAYKFVGFVYAPNSEVDLNGGGPPFLTNVKGGIVSKTIDINGNPNKFQYDSSVSGIDLELDEDVAKITYLHVSVSEVNVTSQ